MSRQYFYSVWRLFLAFLLIEFDISGWQFKQDNLEPSEDIIEYNRTAGIIVLIMITIMFAYLIFR
ncbi:hypothetical protein [Clostridium intestinale]|uniref:hypothetical protein n=1 Tax=Clostridium intestinale TaxID=36845 RepID=UPI0028F000FF|nr:hypothetical protein [Clostridium intestinale]